ncbi:MAG TPA: response regulator [Methylomirabilota bacterium]|nr:response regulator [Methylomirabilota bacterium]
MKVLVVEDEQLVRELLCFYLQRAGHEPVEATSAPEAIAQFRLHEGSIRLVLCDYSLPAGESGATVVATLRRLNAQTSFVLMSGYPLDALALPPEVRRGVVLLQKPFMAEDLMSIVRAAVQAKGLSAAA